MVAREGFVGRAVGRLIAWLAVPRVATFPILLAAGLGVGELAWRFVDSVKILAWASGMAAPFCMICATSVWAMRDRLDDAIDTDQMSSNEYARFDQLAAKHRSRSTLWSGAAAVMALLAAAPAISNQLAGPIWHWTVLAAGAAVTCSLYTYQLASYWETQIRAYRSKQKLSAMKRREKQDLLDEIGAGTGSLKEKGWVEDPPLTTISKHH